MKSAPSPCPLPIQGEGIKREAKKKDPGFFAALENDTKVRGGK
jgi:hypothetical protein